MSSWSAFPLRLLKHVVTILDEKPSHISRISLLLTYLRLKLRYLILVRLLHRPVRSETIFGLRVTFFDYLSFLLLFEEIFINREYWFSTPNAAPVVIDCGANIGMALLYFKTLYPDAQILAFEPDVLTFEVLAKNVHDNGIQNVSLMNCAVAASAGEQSFYYDPAQPGAFVMSLRQERIKAATQLVHCTVLSEYVTGVVDLLKIDVEGVEGPVLDDLHRSGKLAQIDQLIAEYHHHISHAEDNFSQFLHVLEDNGFGYHLGVAPQGQMQPGAFQDILVRAYCKKDRDIAKNDEEPYSSLSICTATERS